MSRIISKKDFKGHPRFLQLLNELEELHHKKTSDYSGDIPLQDLREVREMDIEPWKGIVVRMIHKFGRLKQLTKNNKPMCSNETIKDTLMDIAGYALIAIILFEEERKKKSKRGNLD